jgi:transcriptional regulator with XRE-family HTH domain
MSNALGEYLRKCRTEKQTREGNAFSLRQLAGRIGVEPSYLSKIERGLETRPSEETTRALALELGEDPDVLLAMAGKVSKDLQEIIRKRPQLFAQLIREVKNMPDRAVLRLVREVRDGNW